MGGVILGGFPPPDFPLKIANKAINKKSIPAPIPARNIGLGPLAGWGCEVGVGTSVGVGDSTKTATAVAVGVAVPVGVAVAVPFGFGLAVGVAVAQEQFIELGQFRLRQSPKEVQKSPDWQFESEPQVPPQGFGVPPGAGVPVGTPPTAAIV